MIAFQNEFLNNNKTFLQNLIIIMICTLCLHEQDIEEDGHFSSHLEYHKYVASTCYHHCFVLRLLICRDAVRFSFGPLIQKELDQFVTEWNNHRIRRSNMAEVPNGIPEVLFNFPNLKGTCLSVRIS